MKERGLEDYAELNRQAIALEVHGDWSGALALQERALKHTPEDHKKNRALILDNIANSYLKLKEFPQARRPRRQRRTRRTGMRGSDSAPCAPAYISGARRCRSSSRRWRSAG